MLGIILETLFIMKSKYSSFLFKYSFLERFSHSLIKEGVNAWIICLPSGAKFLSSKVGIEIKITPFSSSKSSHLSTIIWWQLKFGLIIFSSTPI